jgi:hypothetical protein
MRRSGRTPRGAMRALHTGETMNQRLHKPNTTSASGAVELHASEVSSDAVTLHGLPTIGIRPIVAHLEPVSKPLLT